MSAASVGGTTTTTAASGSAASIGGVGSPTGISGLTVVALSGPHPQASALAHARRTTFATAVTASY